MQEFAKDRLCTAGDCTRFVEWGAMSRSCAVGGEDWCTKIFVTGDKGLTVGVTEKIACCGRQGRGSEHVH